MPVKISDMTAKGSALASTDEFEIAENGVTTKSITGANIIAGVGADNLAALTSTSTARTNLGLGNVDNTSDVNKPISNAVQAVLDTFTEMTQAEAEAGTDTDFQLVSAERLAQAIAALAPSSSSGITSIVQQVFTSSGTYTPTTNMVYCVVEVLGGGGGGGKGFYDGISVYYGGAGGGAGGYARSVLSAATVGSSQTVTVGAAGAGATSTNGVTGGTSSFGSLLVCPGGAGGAKGGLGALGGLGGTPSAGALQIPGGRGDGSRGGGGATSVYGGAGSGSPYGYGGGELTATTGEAARGYGAGGSGSGSNVSSGGPGAAGIVIVTDYCTS